MTPRQRKTLDFITGFIAEHGYSPSYDEIGAHLAIKSLSGVHKTVESMIRRGVITKVAGHARSIAVVPPKCCPHCGGAL